MILTFQEKEIATFKAHVAPRLEGRFDRWDVQALDQGELIGLLAEKDGKRYAVSSNPDRDYWPDIEPTELIELADRMVDKLLEICSG